MSAGVSSTQDLPTILYKGICHKFLFHEKGVAVWDKNENRLLVEFADIVLPQVEHDFSSRPLLKNVTWLLNQGYYPLLTPTGLIFKMGLKGGGCAASKESLYERGRNWQLEERICDAKTYKQRLVVKTPHFVKIITDSTSPSSIPCDGEIFEVLADGKLLIAQDKNRTLQIYDLNILEIIYNLPFNTEISKVFEISKHFLVVLMVDGTLSLFDLINKSLDQKKILPKGTQLIHGAISEDFLVFIEGKKVKIWDWKNDHFSHEFTPQANGDVSIVSPLSKENYLVVVSGKGKFIEIWNWRDERCIQSKNMVSFTSVQEIEEYSENEILITPTGPLGKVEIWNWRNGNVMIPSDFKLHPPFVTLSSGYSAGVFPEIIPRRSIQIFNYKTQTLLERLSEDVNQIQTVKSLLMVGKIKHLLTNSEGVLFSCCNNGSITAWVPNEQDFDDLPPMPPIYSPLLSIPNDPQPSTSAAADILDPSPSQVQKFVYREFQTFQIHNDSVRSISIRQDGSIVTCSDKVIKIWKPEEEGTISGKIKNPNTVDKILEFSNQSLVSISHESHESSTHPDSICSYTEIWDPQLTYSIVNTTYVASDPNSKILAIIELPTISFAWNEDFDPNMNGIHEKPKTRSRIYTKQKLFQESTHDDSLNKIPYATICSKENRIKLWNLEEGKSEDYLVGHEGEVTAITLIKEGLLLSASQDKTLRIWSLITKDCLHIMACTQPSIIYLSELDDKRLLAVSAKGIIETWIQGQKKSMSTLMISRVPLKTAFLLSTENLLIVDQKGAVKIVDLETGKVLQSFKERFFYSAAELSPGKIALGDSTGGVSLYQLVDPDQSESVTDATQDQSDEWDMLDESEINSAEEEYQFELEHQLDEVVDELEIPKFDELEDVSEIQRKLTILQEFKDGIPTQVDALVEEESASLKIQVEQGTLIKNELETWRQDQQRAYEASLTKLKESEEKIQRLGKRFDEFKKDSSAKEKKKIKKELKNEIKNQRIIESLRFEQEAKNKIFQSIYHIYQQEFDQLKHQLDQVENREASLEKKIEPLYEKYLQKEMVEQERAKLKSSDKIAVFYKTLEEELGKKLDASILLSSGLLQRAAVKKDHLSEATKFAAEGVCGLIAAMISIGTLGTSTLVVGAVAAATGAVVGHAAGAAVSSRIDKKYTNRANEIGITLGNPKHAWIVAELVARRVSQYYSANLELSSVEINKKWAAKSAKSIYLFIASGELKEKGCQTEEEIIDALIEAAEKKLEKINKEKNSRCVIL